MTDKIGLRSPPFADWLLRFPRLVPAAVFAISALMAVFAAVYVDLAVREREAIVVSAQTAELGATIERRAATSIAFLRAGAALFGTVGNVPSPVFENFVSTLQLDQNYAGTQGIGWATRLAPSEVAAFETAQRSAGASRFRVWPATKDASTPIDTVTYLFPATPGNQQVTGFDMNTGKTRSDAIARAVAAGKPAASAPLALVLKETGKSRSGFLIIMPVFENAAIDPAWRDRRSRVRGFVYSPFRIEDFIRASLAQFPGREWHVRVYDTRKSPRTMFWNSGAFPSAAQAADAIVKVADREWVISVALPPRTVSINAWLVLLFGLAISALLLVIVRLAIKTAQSDRAALAAHNEDSAIRGALTRELNHRVKNTLANVLSIVSLSRRSATSIDDFVEGLSGRIRALSATHDLLVNAGWGSTSLRAVIEAELAPYRDDDGMRVAITGDDVQLTPNDALSLGLAIHELATNAAKYGALSVGGGRISVAWKSDLPDRVVLHWVERGGPPVAVPARRGFGSNLIERAISRELGSPVQIQFEPDGVECTITVPVRRASEFKLKTKEIK